MRKSTTADEALISDPSAREAARASALSRIAHDHLTHLEPQVAALLADPSGWVRGGAIRALLGTWGLSAYFDVALEMLRSDPDADARSHAVGALQSFVGLPPDATSVTQVKRETAIAALLQAFLKDPDDLVELSAYKATVQILTGRVPALPDGFNRDVDADWELLAPYLPQDERRPPQPRPPALSSDEDVALLSDPTATPKALVAAIDRIEADRRYEVAWPIERLQHHNSPLVRGRALLANARTWREVRIGLVEETLREDPGWEARAAAAETVPWLLQTIESFRPNARQMLADALEREEDDRVRAAIRHAIERVDDPAFPPPPDATHAR